MNRKEMNEKQLAGMFDHTLLKAYATPHDFERLCEESIRYGFCMVAINPAPVKLCKELLKGSGVHVGAAVSFPLGQAALQTKLYETEQAIDCGADEIDYVVNIGQVKCGNWSYIEEEMEKINACCKRNAVICKVIFENCYLEKEEIRKLCEIAKGVKPDFIKTSTGFGTGGATVEDVAFMKSLVGNEVKVKAAGGIRSWDVCRQMIEAGAERIGTSSSIDILKQFRG